LEKIKYFSDNKPDGAIAERKKTSSQFSSWFIFTESVKASMDDNTICKV